MHFTSQTSSNGVIERAFILDEVTGVLWSPESGSGGAPLLLSGHPGGLHKKAPGLVARAHRSVTIDGFHVACIKVLHAFPGGHHQVPADGRIDTRFFPRHLEPRDST